MKYFVKRMANVEKLNFEEFGTQLCRIEGLLNSRPLYPNPTSPDEDQALTPFHFLGQRSYNVAPADFGVPLNCPVTKKWLAVLEIQNQFWDKFNNDYLNHLQKKYKWQHPTRSLKIGDLVILHEPNHITNMHPYTRKMKKEFCSTCSETMAPVDILGEWVHMIEVHLQPLVLQRYDAEHMEYIIYIQNHPIEE